MAAAHNVYGNKYVIPVLVGSDQVALATVAAHTTVQVGTDGKVANIAGNDFRIVGVGPYFKYGYPLPPEFAVKTAAETFGVKIARVPVLLQSHNLLSAGCGRWQLVFSQAVEAMDSDGNGVTRDTMFMGVCNTERAVDLERFSISWRLVSNLHVSRLLIRTLPVISK